MNISKKQKQKWIGASIKKITIFPVEIIFSGILQGALLLGGYFSTFLMAIYFPIDQFGLIQSVIAAILLFSGFAKFGIPVYSMLRTARAKSICDSNRISIIYSEGLLAICTSALIFSVILGLYLYISNEKNNLSWMFCLIPLMLHDFFCFILKGHQEITKSQIPQAIIFNITWLLVIIITGENNLISWLSRGYLVSWFLAMLFSIYLLKKTYKISISKFSKIRPRNAINLNYYLQGIVAIIMQVSPVLIAANLFSYSDAGVVRITLQIAFLMTLPNALVSMIALPRLASSWSKENQFKILSRKYGGIVLVSSILVFLIITIIVWSPYTDNFLSKFGEIKDTVTIACFLITLQHLLGIPSIILNASKNEKSVMRIQVIVMLFFIPFGIIISQVWKIDILIEFYCGLLAIQSFALWHISHKKLGWRPIF